jgi:hypothetical protein
MNIINNCLIPNRFFINSIQNNNNNNNNNILSSQKEELISQFYSENLEKIFGDNLNLNLNLDEMHKLSIHEALNSLEENEITLLLKSTQIIFNVLQPTNERRYAVIKLFLKLPSTEWDQVQKLMFHFLGINCCIESAYKFLDQMVMFNYRTAREVIIDQATLSIKFNMNVFDKLEVLNQSAENYLNSLKRICVVPASKNGIMTKINNPELIKNHIRAGKPFYLDKEFTLQKEKYVKKYSLIDFL